MSSLTTRKCLVILWATTSEEEPKKGSVWQFEKEQDKISQPLNSLIKVYSSQALTILIVEEKYKKLFNFQSEDYHESWSSVTSFCALEIKEWILASDWLTMITWPQDWPVIRLGYDEITGGVRVMKTLPCPSSSPCHQFWSQEGVGRDTDQPIRSLEGMRLTNERAGRGERCCGMGGWL